ncbi:MAG: DNA-3-methyladenine glycosylase [Myxococcaceae bacterium]
MPPVGPLPQRFFSRTALVVACDLLGRHLHLGNCVARIVETEAYVGARDLACHASKGKTPRTEVMYGPAGVAYVYLIYGMYYCFNVVTDKPGVGAAVLIRGAEWVSGVAPDARGDGPGRFCRAMGIDKRYHATSVLNGPIALTEGQPPGAKSVRRGPRIGLGNVGEWKQKPYRFWIEGSRGVSRVKP